MAKQQNQQPDKSQFAQIEEQMLQTWEKEDTFQKSLKQREGNEYFSFFDGPPFANGMPHFGHSLVTAIKDSMLRYKTMRGYYVPRINGWDCHGLPVEYAIEKEFDVSGKKEILDLGLDKFNDACRASIFKYKDEWEQFLKRIGRWSDYDNYYATVNTEYTESVWWVMQQVHEKGLLYKGYKSMPYCPRCETPLSNFEVNEGYQDNVPDPSLFMKFKLADEDAYLLGWTTTPWSLPGNAAVAVKPDEKYVYVRVNNDNNEEEVLVLAQKRLEALQTDTYHVVKEITGEDLIGKSYEPLFKIHDLDTKKGEQNLYKVWPADFVSVEDGTGVLHVAPAFGEDDLNLGLENNVPVLSTVGPDGKMLEGIGIDFVAGKFFKDADEEIIEKLTKENRVWAAETMHHTYPFCYRCDSPLLYYAISTWFIKTSEIRDKMLKTAEEINWTPQHIKTGRFGKWLEGARDWAVSRNRYWGAPMPIWANVDDPTDYIVVGSIDELKELAGKDIKVDDLHRPYIDEVTFTKDGKRYERIEEVIDCWFESGSMAVAQQHYPFENQKEFEQTFPADFIIEGLDQTRLWFYVQHVLATILFDRPAYRNVVVNGIIMAADGKKLSKRLKNYPPTDDVFNREGADSWRLYLLSSVQATQTADYMRFDRNDMKHMQRNVMGTLLNSYRFFKTYADIDGWKPSELGEQGSDSELDQWMLSRVNLAIATATEKADDYRIAHAIEPVLELVDDMSNWFIRRSRRRFWKSEDDADKNQAYQTLWYTLTRITQLLAPWAPFVSDHLYRQLTDSLDSTPESVHLTDWPQAGSVDTQLLGRMRTVRELITDGLSLRAEQKIKVRQPLATATLTTNQELSDDMLQVAKEELNVHEVVVKKGKEDTIVLDTTITEDLMLEGLMRDIVRQVQNSRKQAGLNVEDRIHLSLRSQNPDIMKSIKQHNKIIASETLAEKLDTESEYDYQNVVKINGEELTVSLQKA